MQTRLNTAFATLSLILLASCAVPAMASVELEVDVVAGPAATGDALSRGANKTRRSAAGGGLTIVGQPRHDRSTGRVVVSCLDGKRRMLNGDSAGDRFGWSVAVVGDVDGDGVADVAVGAPLDDKKGNASGSVFVFSGRDGRRLFTFHGDTARHQLGYSVAAAGDVDGDGHADVSVGAPFANGRRGLVRIYSGKSGRVLREACGKRAGERLGRNVKTATSL